MNAPLSLASTAPTDTANPTDWSRRVARAFSRAAPHYRRHARAQAAIAEALWPHLPTHADHILDIGCGPGDLTHALTAYYPEARLIGVDLSPAMLLEARQPHHQQRPCWLCADAARLPLADASQALIVSNLAIQWCPDLKATLKELRRVTRPGGRAVINSLAPGTLNEIEQVWRQPQVPTGVLNFRDAASHRLAAHAAGWSATRIEQVCERFHYPDFRAVMDSIKGVGAQLGGGGIRRTRADVERARRRYETLRNGQGLPVSYQRLTLVLDA